MRTAKWGRSETISARGDVMGKEERAPLGRPPRHVMKRVSAWVTYLQVAPLALVFLLFLVVPIATIIVVSFFDYNTTQIIPAFLLQNYEELLLSPVTWRTYGQTIQFSVITWALTLVIGFLVSYFLAFHVHSPTWQMVLFLVCTIPFWTSNVIRMISCIPFLGRNGLANMTLIQLGLIEEPLEFLLFSNAAMMRLVDIRKEL